MVQLELLKRLVRLRSVEIDAHDERVGRFADALCESLNLEPGRAKAIGNACSLHDLGKVVLPDAVLLKPSALTSDEWKIMCDHSVHGYEILRHDPDPLMELAASVALTHHEAFDGSGYPRGLRGQQIPLEGRIANICDVYDALRENRVYRRGLDHDAAMQIILKGDERTSPSQFDPNLLRAFADKAQNYAELFEDYEKVSGRNRGRSNSQAAIR